MSEKNKCCDSPDYKFVFEVQKNLPNAQTKFIEVYKCANCGNEWSVITASSDENPEVRIK